MGMPCQDIYMIPITCPRSVEGGRSGRAKLWCGVRIFGLLACLLLCLGYWLGFLAGWLAGCVRTRWAVDMGLGVARLDWTGLDWTGEPALLAAAVYVECKAVRMYVCMYVLPSLSATYSETKGSSSSREGRRGGGLPKAGVLRAFVGL